MTANETSGELSSKGDFNGDLIGDLRGDLRGDLKGMSENIINPVYIVLFKPIYPRNIGMCARAIANFGLQRLILVAPQTTLTDEAKQGAAHAQRILQDVTIYTSIEEFYSHEGEGLRIALSGKDARLKKSALIEETLSSLARDTSHPVQSNAFPVYLFFGAEDDGLSAQEMSLCHHVCRIPTYSEVNSLNISHAVLLTCFLVRRALETRVAPNGILLRTETDVGHRSQSDELQAAAKVDQGLQPAFYPHEVIHRWLELLGFDLSSPRVNIEKTLSRILLSQTPTADELRTVSSLLHQTVRKLEEKSNSLKN